MNIVGFALAIAIIGFAPTSIVAQTERDRGEVREQGALSAYTMGVFLLENGQPQQAIPHLETAWKVSKDDQIGNKLCEAYFRAGDLKSCEAIIDELLEINDGNTEALLFKARISYFRGEEEAALADLERVRSLSKPSFEVERLTARIQLELGRYEDALTSYGHAAKIDPNYPVIHYRLGVLFRRFGRDKEAEAALRQAIELQPVFTEAVLELAEIYVAQARYDDAEQVLLALAEKDGESYEALMMVANLYAERGKYTEAIELLERRDRDEQLPREGVLLLGRLYYETEDVESALRIFKGMFDEGSRSPELARVLGELSLSTDDTEAAYGYYRDAIELDPNDYRNYIALFFASSDRFSGEGAPIIDLSDEEKSKVLEDAAAVVDADDFDGLYALGICYQSLDDFESARKFFAEAVDASPDSERALLNLAGALERLERYDEAEPILMQLHSTKPDDPRICNFYGYLLALMNTRLDDAEALVKTALKQDPENGYYVDSLGWVYFTRGEYDKAVVELERASRLVGDDPVILEHLGDAYRSLKRYRDAVAAYERSKKLQGENPDIVDKIDSARDQLGN